MSSVIKSPTNAPASYVIKYTEKTNGPINTKKELPPETSIKSAQEKATRIIEEAEKERDIILNEIQMAKQEHENFLEQQRKEWEEEKQKIQDSANQIGYQEGYGEGKRAATKEYSIHLEQIKQTLSRTKEQEEKFIKEMEPQLLEASIRMARKIMNLSIDNDHSSFIELVKKVIKEVKEENDIKIYLHPSAYELVFSRRDDLKVLLQQEAVLTLYPDETLQETQCIIESSFGRIEGGIDQQLEQIKQALVKRLERG